MSFLDELFNFPRWGAKVPRQGSVAPSAPSCTTTPTGGTGTTST